MSAFGIGAGATALGNIYGGAAFTAAGGVAAAGAGGLIGGAVSTGAGFAFGSTFQNLGNAIFFEDAMPSLSQQLVGLGFSMLLGGGLNGIAASSKGWNFFTGEPTLTVPEMPILANGIPAPRINERQLEYGVTTNSVTKNPFINEYSATNKSLIFEGLNDKGIIHFEKHAQSIMKTLEKSSLNYKEYIMQANEIIKSGTYYPNLNGYVKFLPNTDKVLFVGLKNNGLNISTFHVKDFDNFFYRILSR